MKDEKDQGTGEDTEVTKEELLMSEQDLLRGLLGAAEDKKDDSNALRIDVIRKGKVMFSFRIRPLGEDEYSSCREKNTTYVRNNKFAGMKLPEETNTVRYRSALIYTATIEEDRSRIWKNKDAWKALNVLNGIDLIEAVLLAGEKDAIIEKLDEISGYNGGIEAVAKN